MSWKALLRTSIKLGVAAFLVLGALALGFEGAPDEPSRAVLLLRVRFDMSVREKEL